MPNPVCDLLNLYTGPEQQAYYQRVIRRGLIKTIAELKESGLLLQAKNAELDLIAHINKFGENLPEPPTRATIVQRQQRRLGQPQPQPRTTPPRGRIVRTRYHVRGGENLPEPPRGTIVQRRLGQPQPRPSTNCTTQHPELIPGLQAPPSLIGATSGNILEQITIDFFVCGLSHIAIRPPTLIDLQ